MTSRPKASKAQAMVLTPGERQVLALVLVLTRRPQDWETGEPVLPTYLALHRHGARYFGDKLEDWSSAFEDLGRKGLLQHDDHYTLTPRGLQQARRLRREFTREGFGDRLVRSEGSAAYGQFCQQVFGIDLRQFSLLDAEQLAAVLEVLELAAGHRVLDVGCGNGIVTEHIADVSGAHLTGLDIATPAIVRARTRTRDKRHRLRFQVTDFAGPMRIRTRFDRILAIDTLYLTDALDETMGQLLACLEPGGRLGILASDVLRSSDGTAMTPDRTRMHRALSARGLSVQARDFTRNEEEVWRRQVEVAEALMPTFEAEGNSLLGQELIQEATRSLRWVQAGRVRRYLYWVETSRA